ncbi:MAG: NAD(P)-dependent oxidoreductase [Burkholderiales bacterium]
MRPAAAGAERLPSTRRHAEKIPDPPSKSRDAARDAPAHPAAVLLAATLPAALRDALAARYALAGPLSPPFAQAVTAMPDAARAAVRAIVSIGSVAITRDVLAQFPALGLVCCIGSGHEGVDVAAAHARGVTVAHSPGANAASVAEVAMGLLIASVRGFRAEAARIENGGWRGNAQSRATLRHGLAGRRLGIYGMGAIGAAIARRARAFDMEVGYHNRRPRADDDTRYFDSLARLAAWCDALVVSVRAAEATRHTVDAEVLAALGADGHVVNIARGNVIDEAALIDALQRGVIAGAGLDVFEHEPAVPAALLALPGVVALPHIGGASREAQAAMQAMTLANLEAFFAGAPLPSPVAA